MRTSTRSPSTGNPERPSSNPPVASYQRAQPAHAVRPPRRSASRRGPVGRRLPAGRAGRMSRRSRHSGPADPAEAPSQHPDQPQRGGPAGAGPLGSRSPIPADGVPYADTNSGSGPAARIGRDLVRGDGPQTEVAEAFTADRSPEGVRPSVTPSVQSRTRSPRCRRASWAGSSHARAAAGYGAVPHRRNVYLPWDSYWAHGGSGPRADRKSVV